MCLYDDVVCQLRQGSVMTKRMIKMPTEKLF